MIVKKLDAEKWERREIYRYMSSISDPFYTVCFNIDVTNVYEDAHRRGISVYYSMVYLVTCAINEVPAFLNDLSDGEIVVLDRRSPSFCDLRKGSEAFYIVDLLLGNDMEDFCRRAKEASEAQTTFFSENRPEGEAWIYFSSLPWIDMTCVTHERDFDADDTVPRVCWGRYAERDGRKTLNLSLEVSHRFIDGVHIGQFEKCLTDRIAALS